MITADQSIEGVNIILAFVALYGVVMALIWRAKNHLSEQNVAIVIAWVWIFSAVGIQAAWFAVSRHFSNDNEIWLQTMYEMRVYLKIVVMLMFSWGMFSFVRRIEVVQCRWQIALFSTIVLVSFTLTSN